MGFMIVALIILVILLRGFIHVSAMKYATATSIHTFTASQTSNEIVNGFEQIFNNIFWTDLKKSSDLNNYQERFNSSDWESALNVGQQAGNIVLLKKMKGLSKSIYAVVIRQGQDGETVVHHGLYQGETKLTNKGMVREVFGQRRVLSVNKKIRTTFGVQ